MAREPDESGGGGLRIIAVVIGMVGCCALPVLLMSGGLSAVAGWISGDGLGWFLLAVSLAAASFLLWQRQNR